MIQKKYAGIGSRQTPSEVLDKMQEIAVVMANDGWLLRSGGAEGADTAFQRGCESAGGAKEIFRGWPENFDDPRTVFNTPSAKAYDIARAIHPNWDAMSIGGRALHARNIHQVLGADLHDLVDLVICWTKDGKSIGGTRTAIKVAEEHGILIWNLATCPEIFYTDLLSTIRKAGIDKPIR
jgi:hypothetical protein